VTYLFWAFAAVWIGLFVYLRLIMRRTEALEREVEALLGRRERVAHPPEDRTGVAAGRVQSV
jgi:CcmD family protein